MDNIEILKRYKDRMLSLGSKDYLWKDWRETERILRKYPEALIMFEDEIDRQIKFEMDKL